MFYVILFLLTAEVLMCWQADEPEKNTIGCSPAVILICLCVCVLFLMPPDVTAPRTGTLILLLIQQFSRRKPWYLVST